MIDLRGATVSEGTMRPEDLIPKFSGLLQELDSEAYRIYRERHRSYNAETYNDEDDEPEEVAEALDDLFNALDRRAPKGYYFGAYEGDGACYGFWPEPIDYEMEDGHDA